LRRGRLPKTLVAPSGNRGVKSRENRIHRQRRFVGTAPLSLSFFERTFVIEIESLASSPAERDRWPTLAIAVYSRIVAGFFISLDPPGAIAAGCASRMRHCQKKPELFAVRRAHRSAVRCGDRRDPVLRRRAAALHWCQRRRAQAQFRVSPRPARHQHDLLLDPEVRQYNAIPYRNTTYPPLSVWELRESAAMNRHVSFAQAQASVNKLDEQFGRRLFGIAFETLGKPLVKAPWQAQWASGKLRSLVRLR